MKVINGANLPRPIWWIILLESHSWSALRSVTRMVRIIFVSAIIEKDFDKNNGGEFVLNNVPSSLTLTLFNRIRQLPIPLTTGWFPVKRSPTATSAIISLSAMSACE
jgi:hypothetical protein